MNNYYSFDNFDLDLNSSSFQIIIWGLYIGVVLGTLGSILFRVYSGKIIKALINASANGENSAKKKDKHPAQMWDAYF
jgi:gas vesicle protein